MMKLSKNTGARRVLAASAVLVLSLAIAVASNATVREISDGAEFNAPTCQDSNCQVITRTTAYQLETAGKKNPYRVPKSGQLVAYTLYLPKVTNNRPSYVYRYFANAFNGAPTARISVLRPAPRRGTRYRYSLVAQSDRINVKDYLGSTPSFALPKPIPVRRGDVIGITTDSWLPSFRVTDDQASSWRASRPKGKCVAGENSVNFKAPRMHRTLKQVKVYACGYKGSRLLYKATVVDAP